MSVRYASACLFIFCYLLFAMGPVLAADDALKNLIARAVDYPDRWQRDLKKDLTNQPAAILEFTGIAAGMQVLDLYSGNGYWSEIFARAVGASGRVVAHSSAAYREFTGKVADLRFANGRVPRVELLHSELDDLRLGRAKFDIIFLALAYHDIYFYADFSPLAGRDRFLMQLREALKPGGRIIVIDHAALDGRGLLDVQNLHRIEESYLRRDFESNGFVFVAASEALRNPHDDRTSKVFDAQIRFRTDRFVLSFERAPEPSPPAQP